MARSGRDGHFVLPRALLALLLLAGYHLLGPLILAALVGADLFLLHGPHPFTAISLEGYAGSVAVAYSLVRVVYLTRGDSAGRDELPGLPLTPAEQPELWHRVRELARAARTAPPAEIRLIADVNAVVVEDARMLGLVRGKRRLFVGTSLLIGLTGPELDAVVAHELGHYANADTRLATTVWAGRAALARTVGELTGRAAAYQAREEREAAARAARRRARGKPAPVGGGTRGPDHYLAKVYAAYAKLGLRCTEGVSRRQEYAADLVAVRVAGRDSTAAALRRLPGLDAAAELYVRDYAGLGWENELLPPPGQFHGGLALLLADGDRRREMAEAFRWLPQQERTPYDSHPPLAERVAVVEALPPDGRGAPAAGPAVALLRDRDGTFAALERLQLGAAADEMHRVPWHELPHEAERAAHLRAAQPLLSATADAAAAGRIALGGAPGLGTVLDLVDAGMRPQIADLLPKSSAAAGAGGRAAREFARTAFRSALRALTVVALADTGRIRWELSWSGPPVRRLTTAGLAEALEPALDAAIADPPRTAPLRELFHTAPPSGDALIATHTRRLP